MPTTYEPVPAAVQQLIAKVKKKHHAELEDHGVTVDALFCARENKHHEAQPGLKRQGYPLAATIQVTSLADRTRGVADAKLVIDQYAWDRLPEGSRAALIDHELQHLTVARDKYNMAKSDDLGRPKLKTRPHDYELSGFLASVERYGEAAVEVRQLVAFKAEQIPLFPAALQGSLL